MNKVLINQEFHEDVVELVTETVKTVSEERDVPEIERMIQDKIDEVYDEEEWKNNVIADVENMIDDAKNELSNDIEDKIEEAVNSKLDDVQEDITNDLKREIPRLLDRALEERKIDKEQLKEALLELKEDFNLMISEQVKHHFSILAGFMTDQFMK